MRAFLWSLPGQFNPVEKPFNESNQITRRKSPDPAHDPPINRLAGHTMNHPGPDKALAIGVDFGGTSVKIGLVRGGVLLVRAPSIPTLAFPTADALRTALCASIADLRTRYPDTVALGVGMPGLVDSATGTVHELSNVPGWVDFPLQKFLEASTGLPTVIENDANAMTYAEWKYGAGRLRANVVCVTLGTGVGSGLILNSALFRGSRLGAGEIGNMSIDYRGTPGPYGNPGGLEEYVGNEQISARAVAAYRATRQPRSLAECTALSLAEAAVGGDPVAKRLWDETGVMLGAALANVVWLLNPDAIVLGGGVAQAGELLFAPVRRTILERTSSLFHRALEILPADLGNEAGIIGSGALALDTLARTKNH